MFGPPVLYPPEPERNRLDADVTFITLDSSRGRAHACVAGIVRMRPSGASVRPFFGVPFMAWPNSTICSETYMVTICAGRRKSDQQIAVARQFRSRNKQTLAFGSPAGGPNNESGGGMVMCTPILHAPCAC